MGEWVIFDAALLPAEGDGFYPAICSADAGDGLPLDTWKSYCHFFGGSWNAPYYVSLVYQKAFDTAEEAEKFAFDYELPDGLGGY